ncbi:DUF4241 domain-containing protein, partial [Planococcus sp. SIMBA_160]
MIKFTNEQAIEWELATRAGQELKHLKEDEFYGYGVNTGMGCFMDAEAALYLQAYEEFEEAFEQNYKHTWDGSSPVFITGWTLPCLQQASVTGCIQAFGG